MIVKMTLNPTLEDRKPQHNLNEKIITLRIHFLELHRLKPNIEKFFIDVINSIDF